MYNIWSDITVDEDEPVPTNKVPRDYLSVVLIIFVVSISLVNWFMFFVVVGVCQH